MFGHDDNHDDNHRDHDDKSDDTAKTVAADDSWQHPDLSSTSLNDEGTKTIVTPAHQDEPADENQGHQPQHVNTADHSAATDAHNATPDAGGDELVDLKQQALTKLSPLVDKLSQSPDEKFRTLMMMIQASDNDRLIRQAYDTALQIHDEKERAQALLDIINEINYFTQNPAKS